MSPVPLQLSKNRQQALIGYQVRDRMERPMRLWKADSQNCLGTGARCSSTTSTCRVQRGQGVQPERVWQSEMRSLRFRSCFHPYGPRHSLDHGRPLCRGLPRFVFLVHPTRAQLKSEDRTNMSFGDADARTEVGRTAEEDTLHGERRQNRSLSPSSA